MWQRYFRMWQRYFFSMWHICSVCHLCVHPRQVLGHAGVHIGHVLTVGGTPWRHTRQDPLAVLLANKRATGVTLDAKTNKIKNKKIKNNNLRTICSWSKINSIIYIVLTLQADSVPPPTQMCVERMLWKSHRQLQSELVKTFICTCCKTSATPPSAVIKGYIKHPFVKCVVWKYYEFFK